MFSRTFPHNKIHSRNPSPAPLLRTTSTERTRKEGGGGAWWHCPGSGSLLQPGKQGTGEQMPPEPLLRQSKRCHISRQSIKNLPPACLKHDLQKGVCSPTCYYSCSSQFFQRKCCFSKGKKAQRHMYPCYNFQNHLSSPFFALVRFFHRLFGACLEQGEWWRQK